MINNCEKFRNQYEKLSLAVHEFSKYSVDFRNNLAAAVKVKDDLNGLFDFFQNAMGGKLIIPDMRDPFSEVYAHNMISGLELKTKNIDLAKQLEEDCAVYRACGLGDWADEIKKFQPHVPALGREKKRRISEQLKAGAIVIFMPGRLVQKANITESMMIKPFWKMGGREMTVNGSQFFNEPDFIKSCQLSFERDGEIPENPYILVVKPVNNSFFIGSSVKDQEDLINSTNVARKLHRLSPLRSILPPEYVMMQKFFTTRGAVNPYFRNIGPLDYSSYTRFLTLPTESSSDSIFLGRWNDLGNCLFFGSDFKRATKDSGVRLVLREEL